MPAPFIIGTPATAVLSLTATVFPASGPSPDPVIDVVTYHALNGLSAGSGRLQARSGIAGRGGRVELLDGVPGGEQALDERAERT